MKVWIIESHLARAFDIRGEGDDVSMSDNPMETGECQE